MGQVGEQPAPGIGIDLDQPRPAGGIQVEVVAHHDRVVAGIELRRRGASGEDRLAIGGQAAQPVQEPHQSDHPDQGLAGQKGGAVGDDFPVQGQGVSAPRHCRRPSPAMPSYRLLKTQFFRLSKNVQRQAARNLEGTSLPKDAGKPQMGVFHQPSTCCIPVGRRPSGGPGGKPGRRCPTSSPPYPDHRPARERHPGCSQPAGRPHH